MNYEEKYKEALERAKKFEEKYGGDYAGYIFPELAESEDESTRKALIETVKCIYAGDTMFLSEQQRDRYLAWLEKQKEQKPAEWSDEDEKYLNRVINLWVNDFGEDSDTVKWLKSLRPQSKRDCKDCAMFLNGKCTKPHWKPSEEQMKALDKAIPVCMGVVGRDEIAPLESLYEQLKKLINIKNEGIV